MALAAGEAAVAYARFAIAQSKVNLTVNLLVRGG